MMWINSAATLISSLLVLIGFAAAIVGVFVKLKNISNGQQCQLRHDITATYYKHEDEETPVLREFERKDLDDLFDAYKALGGNHFVDDIYERMRDWKVSK